MLHLRKRGDTWHVRGTVAGLWVEQTTGLTDRRAAEAFARDLERDLADPAGRARRAGKATTLQAAVDLTIARYERDAAKGKRSPDTVAFYRKKFGQLLRTLGQNTSLATIDVATVRRHVDARREEGMSEHTIVKEVTALRVALATARDAGLWAGDIEALVPSDLSTDYVPATRALSVVEVQRLLAACSPARAAWVAYMVGAGAEKRAAERARRADLDRAAALVHVRGTKRESRDRHVPVILPECQHLLDLAWEHGAGEGGLLLSPWPNLWRDLQAACDRAGVDPCSSHDLRRTFAHWHLAAGFSFDDVARALGHANTAMLHKVYGKLPPEAFRDRMVQLAELHALAAGGRPSPAAQRVPNDARDGGQEAQTSEGPEMPKAPANKGFQRCRRSDLNQRPWDYDSDRRPRVIALFSPGKQKGGGDPKRRRAQLVPTVAQRGGSETG